MGVFYETIPESLQAWILEQKVIYVASAPLSGSGHVNVSPKGGKYFGIIDERTFWYQDLSGSGIETTSHLHEKGNGRITIMLNAFEGPPKIVRLWGRGTVHENGTKTFNDFVDRLSVDTIPGTRSIVTVDVHQVGTSCGFSMPFFDFKSFRPTLNDFFVKKDKADKAGKRKDGIDHYWAYKNALSMDGLPGMQRGIHVAQQEGVAPMRKMVGPFAPVKPLKAPYSFSLESLVLMAIIFFGLGMMVALYGNQVLSLLLSTPDVRNAVASMGRVAGKPSAAVWPT